MGLLRTLSQWFKRRERPAAPPRPKRTQQPSVGRPPAAATAPTKAAESQRAELPLATVTRRYSRVTVYYRQRGQATELRAPQVLRGPIGAKLHLDLPTIEGCELFAITNYLDRFPESNAVIYLIYEPHVAAPVTVYHRDDTGQLLAEPTVLIGRLNAKYTAAPLAKFAAHAEPRKAQHGRFGKASQVVHFTYHLDATTHREPLKAEYVELQVAKPAFSSPAQQLQYQSLLPAGSFWRVFSIAKDPAGQVFLDLGGSQWITADHATLQRSNPFLPGPSQLRLPHEQVTFNAQPLQRVGQVAAASSVTRWAKPYGDRLPALAAGAKVALLRIVYGSDGSQWYRLADESYILASMVDLL